MKPLHRGSLLAHWMLAGSPIEYLDAPESAGYWAADAKVMTEAARKIGKLD